MSRPPVFVLGVPRSGTTLLRTILDSHSAIACGPETPWLGGHQPRSVMELWKFLREHEKGYCASYRMPPQVATEAARGLVQTLMGTYAASKGKSRWAEKTPDNILHIAFLLELFPEARLIYLTRDGLDVAHSTSVVAEHRKGISAFLEKQLGFGPGVPAAENNPLTALLRWRHWSGLAEAALRGREHLHVSYERLVTEPRATAEQMTAFIGEPFEPAMLDYARFGHEFPGWEWGSADVQTRGTINGSRIGQARQAFPPDIVAALDGVLGHEPKPDLAASDAAATMLSGLGTPWSLGRATLSDGWLWVHGLARLKPGARVRFLGDGKSPLAWALALLGAKVRFTTGAADPAMARLRDGLRVNVSWSAEAAPCDAVVAARPSLGAEWQTGLAPNGLLAIAIPPGGAAPDMSVVHQGTVDGHTVMIGRAP